MFLPGDPIPEFKARTTSNPRYTFYTVAGRYVVLSFLGSASDPRVRQVVAHVERRQDVFDDRHASFFGVSVDPDDEACGRLRDRIPGIRYFWDAGLALSRVFGAIDAAAPGGREFQAFTLVLDPMLRVIAHIPLTAAQRHNAALDAVIAGLPPVAEHAGTALNAPVLVLPRVFDDALCRQLIALYQRYGGQESGFMREVAGKTVEVREAGFKRRHDFAFDTIPELDGVRASIRACLERRLLPQIKRAFQFDATRMERFLVARYDAASGGFFRPHKDNTTLGTAHRRFACTINLNAGDYTGGDLRFPEFGPRTYRAPSGGAIVFSCSLLHEATPVGSGVRYAFLPFFYDEAGARQRQENASSLTGQVFDRAKGESEYAALARAAGAGP
ncbi:2OG-Fe(II) oxygenase [Massilia sp. UMI-21]|nr:2OG-Fe(II) oxygenase [Massilia sp. UMI-21]